MCEGFSLPGNRHPHQGILQGQVSQEALCVIFPNTHHTDTFPWRPLPTSASDVRGKYKFQLEHCKLVNTLEQTIRILKAFVP